MTAETRKELNEYLNTLNSILPKLKAMHDREDALLAALENNPNRDLYYRQMENVNCLSDALDTLDDTVKVLMIPLDEVTS